MQCDFYECADLIDELETMQQREANARIRESKIKGEARVLSLCTVCLVVHVPDCKFKCV